MDILEKIDLFLGEARGVKLSAFNVDTAKDWVEALKKGIKAPFIGISISTLGGDSNVAILFKLSLDDKKDWKNGILENSRWAMVHIQNDGTITSEYGPVAKGFRKTNVKDAKEAVNKINKHLEKF